MIYKRQILPEKHVMRKPYVLSAPRFNTSSDTNATYATRMCIALAFCTWCEISPFETDVASRLNQPAHISNVQAMAFWLADVVSEDLFLTPDAMSLLPYYANLFQRDLAQRLH